MIWILKDRRVLSRSGLQIRCCSVTVWGGTLSHDLLNRLFLPELGKAAPRALDDSAIVIMDGQRYAITTDSHVVSPLFFPGGDIGRLAICGTVNDLAIVSAMPVALTCGFVIEEGLSFDLLQRVIKSMQEAAQEAGIYVAAGDTKVVQKGGQTGYLSTPQGLEKSQMESTSLARMLKKAM